MSSSSEDSCLRAGERDAVPGCAGAGRLLGIGEPGAVIDAIRLGDFGNCEDDCVRVASDQVCARRWAGGLAYVSR